MKRLTALLLALLMMFSLFACSDETPNTDDPSTDPTGNDEYNPYPYEDLTVFMDMPSFDGLKVTETDIQNFITEDIANMLLSENLYVQIFEGEAKNWDKTVIDFVGTIDGEVFDGGTGKDYPLVLGSGSFVPGFEEGMIGMKVGEVRPITFNFPENYHEGLSGKEVTFTVTLKELYVFPEINDEFCEKYTFCKTTEEFYAKLRTEYIRNYAFNTLLERCTLKKNPEEYTEYYQSFISYFSGYAQQYGTTLENFVSTYGGYFTSYGLHSGIKLDGFYTVAENYAKSNTVNDLLMYSVIRKHDLKTEGEGYEKAKTELLSAYEGKTIADLEKEYGKTAVITSVMNIQMMDSLVQYVEIEK